MNILGTRSKILLMSVGLMVSMVAFVAPQKASAAGETYRWQGQQIIGENGLIKGFIGQRLTFNKQTQNVYMALGAIEGCGSAGTPRYKITLTSANGGTLTKELRGCINKGPDLPSSVTITGSAPSGAFDGNVSGTGTNAEADVCESESGGMGWFMCEIIERVVDATTWFDCQVLNLLTIDTNAIFNDGSVKGNCDVSTAPTPSPRSAESSKAFHTAWGVFRNIAYGLLLIIGLIMIISQIAGLELFDAYAIRKMLPKLVVAVILIALSWNALAFIFRASNDAAYALMNLIQAPFSGINANIGTDGGDITVGVIIGVALATSLVAGGVYLWVLGPVGVGALVLSILLAVFAAFILLAARNVVAYMLVVAAPVAIICYTFEPFKKLFTLWRTLLVTILLSVPIIAAVIQMSHVGALIAYISDNTLATITAIAILIGGYAMIWTIFKKLDAVTGQLGNIVSGATGRIQKGLSQYRSNQAKQRFGEVKTGERDWGKAGSLVRQASLAGRPGQGNFFTKKGRKQLRRGEAHLLAQTAAQLDKNQADSTFGNDDAMAVLTRGARNRKDFIDKYVERARAKHFRDGGDEAGWQAKQASARAEAETSATEIEATSRAKIGSRALQRAAAQARWTSASAYNDHDLNTEEGQIAMRQEMAEEIGTMINSGLMTAPEVAGTMKKNTQRTDISGQSFPKMMVQAGIIAQRQKARDEAKRKGGTVRSRQVETDDLDKLGVELSVDTVSDLDSLDYGHGYSTEKQRQKGAVQSAEVGGLLSRSELDAWDIGTVEYTTAGQRIGQRTESVKIQAKVQLKRLRKAMQDSAARVQAARAAAAPVEAEVRQIQGDLAQASDYEARIINNPSVSAADKQAAQQQVRDIRGRLADAQQRYATQQTSVEAAEQEAIRQAAAGSAEHTVMSSYASPENARIFEVGYLGAGLYGTGADGKPLPGPDGRALTVHDYIEGLRASSDIFRRYERSYTQSGSAAAQAALAQQQAAGAQAGPTAPPPMPGGPP